jgi:predicted enzyme related to lactoylglutathione lyase
VKPRGVDFVSYTVTDMARSQAFYRDVLGLEATSPWGGPGTSYMPFAELEAGGTAISLTQLPGGPHPNGIIALAVEDVAAAVEELRGKGVEIEMERIETPDCFMAVIADPDGNKLLLHQRKDGTAG